jgi:hypothetical protein
VFRKMAASGAFCALVFLSPARAQQYQIPSGGYPTGGGIVAPGQGGGGGLSQPSEGAGGGIVDPPYSSYSGNSVPVITGGGLNPLTQAPTGGRASAVAPNGETYKSLGISGY